MILVDFVTSVGSITIGEMLEKNSLVEYIELQMYLVYNTAFMPSLQNCRIFQFGVGPG